ncbi:hypothetical protein CHS0354_015058 [Potamilus streckersoni]|uniref:Phosphagen kinase N-terminal domain-containing protein n=1 Tax=Potamilus streckersoni TaxID=2493646 RepID=A0AAE0TGB8_9BIVA|nr:hypothetical protein CHS0354_015058 [Potamilus streckersoni]
MSIITMGNSQGHSNEVETVKEEKETPSCCELKRRKSKSKGAAQDDQDDEETREELSLGNVSKDNFDNVSLNTGSNDGLTQHVTEVNVASYVASDDRANNSLPQQDITKSEISVIEKCDSTSKLKLYSDISDSPECSYKCGELQAMNVNDATNEKEGTIVSNHESSKRSVTNDAFNSSVLRVIVESGVPVQSVLHVLENTGNLEQENGTVFCTHDHICHAGVIMPETINTSTPIMINTHIGSYHVKSPEAPDSSLTFKRAMDCLDRGGKPKATVQLENPGACNVESTVPESPDKHLKVNIAKDCLDFVRKPSAIVLLEKQDACGVELAALESNAIHSKSKDNLSSDVKHEIAKSSCESGEVEETEIWKATTDEACEKGTFTNMNKTQNGKGEEEFVMVETVFNTCPIKEDSSAVQQIKLENQDVILNCLIKDPDKQISQDSIDDRSCENHSVQGGILSVDSATRKSDTSPIASTVNKSAIIQQGEKESVIKKNDEIVKPLEGNMFSEKQDSDSLKDFEETELLCLSDVEESNVVKNVNKDDIGQPVITGLGDRETTLSHNVLRNRDEPKVEKSSIKPSSNINAKLQSGSKLQYSCFQENIIKHNASKESEFLDMDQDSKNREDCSSDMQNRINSKASNEEQFRREEDGTRNQKVDQLKVAKSDESEDGIVPPPTPSSMAIWREEDEEEREEDDQVSHKGQMKQMVSEFGDIVFRRLSLLLESQTLLSITDDDDIPVCENVFFASGMDEKEREYREDITRKSKADTELKDKMNTSFNAEKENLVGLIDVDSVIENSKQIDEEVINMSSIFPKLDEKSTVDIKDVRLRQDKRVFLTEEVPACKNNLFHSESASERSGDGNLDKAVSADKAHSVHDRDKSLLNEHIKQDLEVKEIDEETSEGGDIQATSSTGAKNKHNYLFGNDEEDVVEVMDALDDVIDEAYSQVFTTEKEERFLKAVVETRTTHMTDQTEDEQDTKSLKMNEIDPARKERKEHHEDRSTKKTLNPADLMGISLKFSKYQEGCDNVDSIVDDSWTSSMERDNAFSLNNLTLVDSITMQHVASTPDETSTTPIEQEPTVSLKIQKMEEAYSRAQTVDELGDRTPTAESFPELTALTELASAAVDNLVQYQPSGRLSVSRTESDIDISEQRDDLSTEGMYADDEDDETMEILFTRTYTEPKQGTEAFVSCTVVNSAYRQANRDGSYLKYAVPETLDLLEGSIEVMPPSFIKAKKEMRDIQVHLQSLRKQMEHFHNDIDESSLPDLDYLTPDPQPRRAITD